MNATVYIVGAARTPLGSFLGSLAEVPAPKLGAAAIEGALQKAHLSPDHVELVLMGQVLTAGVGQAPARQAAIYAGIPESVPCTTVGKVCGSGLQAILFGAQQIMLGEAQITVCGGQESMSRAPYYLPKARTGLRMGNGELVDGMISDGLWDPYRNFHMGMAGELCAREFGFSREDQDDYAAESYRRALQAQASGEFSSEIVPVHVPQAKGEPIPVSADEEPARGNPSKMSKLRPAFTPDGTITAANASKINDGASALVLASEQAVKEHRLTPLARIVGYASLAQAPEWFTTAPAAVIQKTLQKLNMTPQQIDLFEINEAFSVVAMHAIRACELDPERVNVRGGAVALGHPIGCSGARITTTLVHALMQRKARYGLSTLCIGGGEALALVVENLA